MEVELGWRGRGIALAALGAAVLGRSAFGRFRTGGLEPVEMQPELLDDEERVVLTEEGVALVEDWLDLVTSLFERWPPVVPGVDDATG